MNKKVGLFLVALILSSFLIGFVSAAIGDAPTGLGQKTVSAIEQIVNTINPLAKYLLGETAATATITAGELLFAKILFFLIILGVIYLALGTVDFFNYQAWVLWVVSIGASILATRFLGNTIVPAILIPYSALGFFISAGIPFFLAFVVITRGMAGDAHRLARKISWIFFAVIFIGLWIVRGSDNQAAWVYVVTAIAALIMMAMDGTLQSLFNQMALDKATAMRRGPALQNLDNLINGVHDAFAKDGAAYYQHYPSNAAVTGLTAYKNDIKELEQRRKHLIRSP
jgi:hypothetical protein